MSKLLGIVNPKADPADHFNYWLWRNDNCPWDAEQLNIEKMPVEGGNVQFRIIGPHTPKVPDGVFLKMQLNADLNPEAKIAGGEVSAPPPIEITPNSTDAATPAGPSVSTPERLEGETKAQQARRKAIALRWQAAKLEKLAEDMEVLEAQGLI